MYSSHVFTNPEFSICNCFEREKNRLFDIKINNSYIGILKSILILMLLACDKKSYLICEEITNFRNIM